MAKNCGYYNDERIPRGMTVTQRELNQAKKDFDEKLGTEEQAIEWLIEKGHGKQLCCFYCKGTDLKEREFGKSTIYCKPCMKETSLFADTLFHRMGRPRAYAGYFWLRERGIGLSANRHADFCGVAQSTADDIYKKVSFVVMESLNAAEPVFVESREFMGLYTRRSKQTNKEAHPSSEQIELDQKERDRTDNTKESAAGFSNSNQPSSTEPSHPESSEEVTDLPPGSEEWNDAQKAVYQALSHVPLYEDLIFQRANQAIGESIGALTLLLLSNHVVELDGGRYVRAEHRAQPISQNIRDAIEQAHSHVKKVYEGISRKNAQPFLADYWTFACRTLWTAENLVKACFNSRPIRSHEIRSYVSPKVVQLLPA